jgi:Arc/MetJ-type ribon-helix-helix transcriptional regulator
MKRIQRTKRGGPTTKTKIVNIRLRPDQEEKIDALVKRSAILDTSKVVRIAVDWLLMSDIGEVLAKIVNPQAFPDYQILKKRRRRQKRAH